MGLGFREENGIMRPESRVGRQKREKGRRENVPRGKMDEISGRNVVGCGGLKKREEESRDWGI